MIGSDSQETVQAVQRLWNIWRQQEVGLAKARSIRVFKALFSTLPEDRYQVHWDRRLLLNIVLDE